MKTLYEFVKEFGWMPVVAIVLILSGYALGTDISFKKVIDGEVAGSFNENMGFILIVLGFVFLMSTLVNVEVRLTEARTKTTAAESAVAALRSKCDRAEGQATTAALSNHADLLVSVRAQVAILRAILDQHRAMKGYADEDNVTRVFRSAQRMRIKMDEIILDVNFSSVARALAQRVSVYCSEFLNSGEYLERRSGHSILAETVAAEIRTGNLDEQDRQSYIANLSRWRTQISKLVEGAEIAAGGIE